MPRVSVVIPAHNAARFLPAALDSVRAQTFTDWEVVAVDDGSSDDTWSILESAGPRVRAFRNDQSGGPAAARNRALTEATGEFVAFLDSDDLFLPRYLESQLDCWNTAVTRGRKVGLVTCDALVLEEERYADHTYLGWVRRRDQPLTLDRVLRRNPIYIGSLVPVEVGQSVGWFDPELFGTEDFGLWLKILERGFEAILNPEPLAVYRRHSGTVSSDIARQGANNRRTYELSLARGHLNRSQRRIAREAVRYNRAMEAVARVRFERGGDRSLRRLIPLMPLLAWVAVTNPHWWGQWLAILRTGRLPPAAKAR